MNEQEFYDALDRYLEGLLAGRELEDFLHAVESNPEYRAELEAHRALVRMMEELPREKAPPTLRGKIMDQLRAEAALEAVPAPAIRKSPPPSFLSRLGRLFTAWQFQTAVACTLGLVTFWALAQRDMVGRYLAQESAKSEEMLLGEPLTKSPSVKSIELPASQASESPKAESEEAKQSPAAEKAAEKDDLKVVALTASPTPVSPTPASPTPAAAASAARPVIVEGAKDSVIGDKPKTLGVGNAAEATAPPSASAAAVPEVAQTNVPAPEAMETPVAFPGGENAAVAARHETPTERAETPLAKSLEKETPQQRNIKSRPGGMNGMMPESMPGMMPGGMPSVAKGGAPEMAGMPAPVAREETRVPAADVAPLPQLNFEESSPKPEAPRPTRVAASESPSNRAEPQAMGMPETVAMTEAPAAAMVQGNNAEGDTRRDRSDIRRDRDESRRDRNESNVRMDRDESRRDRGESRRDRGEGRRLQSEPRMESLPLMPRKQVAQEREMMDRMVADSRVGRQNHQLAPNPILENASAKKNKKPNGHAQPIQLSQHEAFNAFTEGVPQENISRKQAARVTAVVSVLINGGSGKALSFNEIESKLKSAGVETRQMRMRSGNGAVYDGLRGTIKGKDMQWLLGELASLGIQYDASLDNTELGSASAQSAGIQIFQKSKATAGVAFIERAASGPGEEFTFQLSARRIVLP